MLYEVFMNNRGLKHVCCNHQIAGLNIYQTFKKMNTPIY